uniref:Tc1-like transposase DDE domain-containing protein n=1 Tax=Stegastes partitus TaxID=144197 RepID=A0A3B4ZMR7_9TELE
MAREVYKNGHQFQTVDALREAIFTTWSNIPMSLLESLASSMPKQIFEVIMVELCCSSPRLCGNDWVFQQDNAPIHNARLTKTFFQEKSITLNYHLLTHVFFKWMPFKILPLLKKINK